MVFFYIDLLLALFSLTPFNLILFGMDINPELFQLIHFRAIQESNKIQLRFHLHEFLSHT